jgi:hypothetical protein
VLIKHGFWGKKRIKKALTFDCQGFAIKHAFSFSLIFSLK